jgi:hypothetical protein
MKDSLQKIAEIIVSPVPLVNVTVLFGLTAGQWDLLMKIIVGLLTAVWTGVKIWKEYKKKD